MDKRAKPGNFAKSYALARGILGKFKKKVGTSLIFLSVKVA